MKIAMFGDVSDKIEIIKAIKEIETDLDIEIVDIELFKDERIIVMCGHPLANVGIEIEAYRVDVPHIDNSFRGGSTGKGGKIKYRRG